MAASTPPDDQYFLALKRSPNPILASLLCFEDSSVYFQRSPEQTRNRLALADIESIQRDSGPQARKGYLLGAGITLGAVLASYHIGRLNSSIRDYPHWKVFHVLGGMLVVPFGGLIGSIIGEVKGSEELYESGRGKGYARDVFAAKRARLGCEPPLPAPGQSSPSVAIHPGAVPPAAEPQIAPAAPALGEYRDLKPEVEAAFRRDSISYRNSPKHRLMISGGLGGFLDAGGGPVEEYLHLALTRLLFTSHGALINTTVGFSRLSEAEETGSRYLVDLLAGTEKPLGASFLGEAQFGIRYLYPFDIAGEDVFIPGILTGFNLGLSWKRDAWVLGLQGYFFTPLLYSGLRLGAGIAF